MTATAQATHNPSARAGKFLTFHLASEEYGIEILKVQEIIGLMPITTVPRIPSFMRGVINLRGKVIPVVDFRRKFGMESAEPTAETCIIVVQSAVGLTGLIVDRVCEVVDIAASDIEDTPAFGPDVNVDYLLGIGKSHGRVKLLLDVERVLSSQDLTAIHLTTQQGEG